jgi:hypothetical protein
MSDEKIKEEVPKEEKVLPFYNLNLDKQIDLVKAYVAFFDKNKKAAHYKDVASIAGVHPTQVSGCRRFWRYLGLLEEKDGIDIPSKAASEFVRKLEWDKEDDAWTLFRNQIENKWFVSHIGMVLRLQKKMTRDDLVNSLGSAASINRKDPHVVESLHILLELLTRSKIIKEDKETNSFIWTGDFDKSIQIDIPQDKDMIQIIIGQERYAVDKKKLEEFVEKEGRKLNDKQHRLE